jgi:hypothetical protein
MGWMKTALIFGPVTEVSSWQKLTYPCLLELPSHCVAKSFKTSAHSEPLLFRNAIGRVIPTVHS